MSAVRTTGSAPSYQLHNLTVRHPAGAGSAQHPALEQLDLLVQPGEQIALIGPSGAGKTTLLSTLALAQRPHSGAFQAFGLDPWALAEGERHRLRARLFLAPQTPPLPPRQRVVTAVLAARLPQWGFWRAFASLLKPADPQAAFDALSRFNLGDKLYARVDRLSGGERQRCGLARLLLSQAETLLVDEPLSALDPALSELTLATLRQEAAARNATLLCSLHQVELALAHFPRIVALKGGRIAFDLPRAQVTPELIAALYQGASAAAPQPAGSESAQEHTHIPNLDVGACL
jgi:phosphonate transport system ATP-binding protein